MTQYLWQLGAAALVVACAVPASASAQNASAQNAPAPTASSQSHPDFSGIWGGGVEQLTPTTCKTTIDAFPPRNNGEERFKANGATGTQQYITFEQDCAIAHRGQVSKPQYKPELWEKVRLSDYHANAGGKWIDYADPEWQNLPRGLPRIGPPNKIVQTANEVIFLYEYQNTFRVAPTDCREHDPVLKFDQTFYGLAVGCWEGNELVVTSMGFTDRTWLDWPGYFHSAEMKVTERFRREGDTMFYTATVDDPVVLLEPWVMPTRRLNLNKTPGVQLMQDVPYQDHSLGNLVDPENRG
jgi:hypothetical protein